MHTQQAVQAALESLAHPPADGIEAIGLAGRFSGLARRRPDRIAVVQGDERVSYEELDHRANGLARALTARGVKAGDTVAFAIPNSVGVYELLLAAWKLGATPLPLNYRTPPAERRRLDELADPALVVGMDDDDVTLDQLRLEAKGEDDTPLPDRDSRPWLAIASGGSTGRHKLIVKDETGPVHPGIAGLFGIREDGVELVAGPLYHSGPLSWSVMQLMAGGTVVVMERFDPAEYLRLLEAEQVTWSMVVPTMLKRIADLGPAAVEATDFSRLEVLLHGAAACSPDLKRRILALFGAERVWEVYGSTELGITLVRGDEWLERPGTVGRMIATFEATIRDDAGAPLPPGEVGEIWIRPHGALPFAYRGATPRIADDGAVGTGDMGRMDDAGYLWIADRRVDMIVTGGSNVFPAEVEGVLLEHPDVADAVVIGLPDPEWGHRVHAVVQLHPTHGDPTEDDIRRFCREHLMPYKVPKSVEIVDSLPRDASGKLRRSDVRQERMPTGDG